MLNRNLLSLKNIRSIYQPHDNISRLELMRHLAFSILQCFLIIWHSQPNHLNVYILKRKLDTYKVCPFPDIKLIQQNTHIYHFWPCNIILDELDFLFSVDICISTIIAYFSAIGCATYGVLAFLSFRRWKQIKMNINSTRQEHYSQEHPTISSIIL